MQLEVGVRTIPRTPWYGFPFDNNKTEPSFFRSLNDIKPATSVHLRFEDEGFTAQRFERIRKNGWAVENTIIVRHTEPGTYFSVLQFPGAYAGIQQLESERCGMAQGISSVYYPAIMTKV